MILCISRSGEWKISYFTKHCPSQIKY